MNINTKIHTIIMLIGPTESGKTTFAKEVLIPQLQYTREEKNYRSNVQYISSDAIRQELLGHPYDKYVQTMMESSQQAFDLLFTKLKAVTSFPVNADFVILDTTGLSEEFRKQVSDIAKENNYHLDAILFDYKNPKDYYNSERSKRLIASHTTRLKRDVIPTIRKNDYTNIHRIKKKDFLDNPDYLVEVDYLEEYFTHLLPNRYKYTVIGDVHEKVEDLKILLTENRFELEGGEIVETEKTKNKRLVLVGDWIDKGGETKEIIEFLYQNKKWFYFVKGNHENFVSKYLQGKIENEDKTLIENYFDSIPVLQENQELKEKFLELVESSKDFYRYIGDDTSSFYVTHAPCENKYVGKMDAISRKRQRRFALDRSEEVEKQLEFLEKEAVINNPYHVFGHVATKKAYRIKNKIGIDTGIVYGNCLTSVDLSTDRPYFRTKNSNEELTTSLPLIFAPNEKNVKIKDLNDYDKKRIRYVLKNKINFISGTMSPSDRDLETEDLESLKQGLLYFKEKGVEKAVLQPKYMGSRCNIYLDREIQNCFASTRNGYKINHVDLSTVYEALLEKYKTYMDKNNLQTLVLDGELLPWKALGKGLIERKFEVVEKAIGNEIMFLKENGFEENFEKLVEKYDATNFDQEEVKSSKKELIKKYGHTDYSTFKHLKEALRTKESLDTHENAYQVFSEQLRIYGQDAPLEYKAFSILKEINLDGQEKMPEMKSSEMFALLSDDTALTLDLTKEDSFEKAEVFFNDLTTEKKMEGVVIKPEENSPGVAPYMKVRNPNYLTIVYGYDYKFPHKHKKLIKQKNIWRKLKTSIAEYNIGQEMLKFKLGDISPENKEYRQVVANILFETSKEKEIDPRL